MVEIIKRMFSNIVSRPLLCLGRKVPNSIVEVAKDKLLTASRNLLTVIVT